MTKPNYSTEKRKRARAFRRLAAQVSVVNRLHVDRDGTCVHCRIPYPCPTRSVMRLASNASDKPAYAREDAYAVADAVIAALVCVPGDEPQISNHTTIEGIQ